MVSDRRLYEIGAELEAIFKEMADADGELTPELEARLDAAQCEFPIKAERVICAIRNEEARVGGIEWEKREQIRRLDELARPHRRTAESLRKYLEVQMRRSQVRRVNMPKGKAWIQKDSRPAIKYVGMDENGLRDVPEQFVRTTRTPKGDALYEAWKKDELPIMFEADLGDHLRIR